jgi:ubiquinone/menaquinone biosynthesis C-methylase UbiE
MLKWASMIAPSAGFVVGTAEAIPLCDHSVDLITAAGSLNYANLDLFFPEAARVRMMTETNVAAAVRSGVPHSQIKSWCAETLAPVWNGPEREVQFRGYFACMSAA